LSPASSQSFPLRLFPPVAQISEASSMPAPPPSATP
jgi:hypothetical protein